MLSIFISFNSLRVKISLRNKCCLSTTKLYHRLCSPSTSTLSKNLQIEHVILKGIILFFLMKICLLTSLSSKNFGFIIFVNQSFKVSTVNFNSTENNSAREADFSRAKTAEAASLAERKLSN